MPQTPSSKYSYQHHQLTCSHSHHIILYDLDRITIRIHNHITLSDRHTNSPWLYSCNQEKPWQTHYFLTTIAPYSYTILTIQISPTPYIIPFSHVIVHYYITINFLKTFLRTPTRNSTLQHPIHLSAIIYQAIFTIKLYLGNNLIQKAIKRKKLLLLEKKYYLVDLACH